MKFILQTTPNSIEIIYWQQYEINVTLKFMLWTLLCFAVFNLTLDICGIIIECIFFLPFGTFSRIVPRCSSSFMFIRTQIDFDFSARVRKIDKFSRLPVFFSSLEFLSFLVFPHMATKIENTNTEFEILLWRRGGWKFWLATLIKNLSRMTAATTSATKNYVVMCCMLQ